MLSRMVLWLTRRSVRARRWLFPFLFEQFARRWRRTDEWTYMNYGFADIEDGPPVLLQPADEPERYCAQLYHRATRAIDLLDKDVIEISCGRGGGASYVRRYLSPRTVTAIDISPAAVAFCRRVHQVPGLRFLQGDAEDLPLFEASADAIINIEASLLYADVDRFLAEVRRVLRPGGHLLLADLRVAGEIPELMVTLERSGLEILQVDDITPGVLRALELDHDRRDAWVRRLAPWVLHGPLRTFAGTLGTRMPTFLASGRMRYLCLVLRRPIDDVVPPAAAAARVPGAQPAPRPVEAGAALESVR
jgi:SAM-dependent methyltransferase